MEAETPPSALEHGITVMLVIITFLSIAGVVHNIRVGNRGGILLGGMLTLGLATVTFLAVCSALHINIPLIGLGE